MRFCLPRQVCTLVLTLVMLMGPGMPASGRCCCCQPGRRVETSAKPCPRCMAAAGQADDSADSSDRPACCRRAAAIDLRCQSKASVAVSPKRDVNQSSARHVASKSCCRCRPTPATLWARTAVPSDDSNPLVSSSLLTPAVAILADQGSDGKFLFEFGEGSAGPTLRVLYCRWIV